MVLAEGFTHGVGHGGLGAVGNDFQRVDEVFASMGELQELVFFGEFFEFDVARVFFASRLELIDLARFEFDRGAE